MKRKIIQIANSTQLISLPRKWCITNELKKGAEIDVEEQGNQIIISPDKKKSTTSIEVDVTGFDRTSLIYSVRALYKKGYDEIKLLFKEPLIKHFRVNKDVKVITVVHDEANLMPGMEVIQQKENFCVLKAISEASSSEFKIILKRIFGLFIDVYSDLTEGGKANNIILLESIKEKHDTITKFISHSLRLLNRQAIIEKNNYFLFHILAQLDKIGDLLKIVARNLIEYNKKIEKSTSETLEDLFKNFEMFNQLFYKFDKKLIKDMNKNKEKINNKILKNKKLPLEEFSILITMQTSLELIRDLTESVIAMKY